MAYLLGLGFLLLQIIYIYFLDNGPFTDEAIYFTAGRRILEGYSTNPNNLDYSYYRWFQGSPLIWPQVSAFAYQIGGLPGSRLVAAILTSATLTLSILSTTILFGKTTGLFGGLILGLLGNYIFLGHFAVYDCLALFFASLAYFLTLKVHKEPKFFQIVVIALLITLAAITKYPYLIIAAPIALLLLHTNQSRTRILLTTMLLLVVLTLFSSYWLALFENIRGPFSFYTKYNGKPIMNFAIDLLNWLWIPITLSIVGLYELRSRNMMGFALPFLIPIILIVGSHILLNSHVSAEKHIVLGLFFAAPLFGLGCEWLQRKFGKVCLILCFVVFSIYGNFLAFSLSHTWPDTRPTVSYLEANWTHGNKLLAEDGWVYRGPLYWTNKIESPFQIHDSWNIDHGKKDFCSFRWFVTVDIPNSNKVDRVADIAQSCNAQVVYKSPIKKSLLENLLGISSDDAKIILYEKSV